MPRGSSQAPTNGHYALLALIPPAAGLFVWRAVEHLAHLDHAWMTLGAGVPAGVTTAAASPRACDCFELHDGDDSEDRAFEVAHRHSPTVRRDIAVQF